MPHVQHSKLAAQQSRSSHRPLRCVGGRLGWTGLPMQRLGA